jgi:hypothetical protein
MIAAAIRIGSIGVELRGIARETECLPKCIVPRRLSVEDFQ